MALLLAVAPLLFIGRAHATDLVSRRVVIGSSKPGEVTNYRFDFTIPSFTNVGSIKFQFCTNNPYIGTPCTAPAGFSSATANLTAQSGETGFAINGGLMGTETIVISRASVPTTGVPASYTFSPITNPTSSFETVYVRIATYASTDTTGPLTDSGAVVFSTTSGIGVDGFVPPYLTFCVGVTVAPDCTTSTGNLLDFGELKSNTTRQVASELAGSTNDPGGYSVFLNGTTMTSGNNTITGLSVPATSQRGVSQFGLNLRANSNPSIGADPSGIGTAIPSAQLNSPNLFYFGNISILSSPLPTNFNKFTASYIVNVSSSQPPGIYSTTLTYVAIAAF